MVRQRAGSGGGGSDDPVVEPPPGTGINRGNNYEPDEEESDGDGASGSDDSGGSGGGDDGGGSSIPTSQQKRYGEGQYSDDGGSSGSGGTSETPANTHRRMEQARRTRPDSDTSDTPTPANTHRRMERARRTRPAPGDGSPDGDSSDGPPIEDDARPGNSGQETTSRTVVATNVEDARGDVPSRFSRGRVGQRAEEAEQEFLENNPGYDEEDVDVNLVETDDGEYAFQTDLNESGEAQQQQDVAEDLERQLEEEYDTDFTPGQDFTPEQTDEGYVPNFTEWGERRVAAANIDSSTYTDVDVGDVRRTEDGWRLSDQAATSEDLTRREEVPQEHQGDRIAAEVDAYTERTESVASEFEQQVEDEYGVDVERGEDYTIEPTDEGARTQVTDQGMQKLGAAETEAQLGRDAIRATAGSIAGPGVAEAVARSVDTETARDFADLNLDPESDIEVEDGTARLSEDGVATIQEANLESQYGEDFERGEDFRVQEAEDGRYSVELTESGQGTIEQVQQQQESEPHEGWGAPVLNADPVQAVIGPAGEAEQAAVGAASDAIEGGADLVGDAAWWALQDRAGGLPYLSPSGDVETIQSDPEAAEDVLRAPEDDQGNPPDVGEFVAEGADAAVDVSGDIADVSVQTGQFANPVSSDFLDPDAASDVVEASQDMLRAPENETDDPSFTESATSGLTQGAVNVGYMASELPQSAATIKEMSIDASEFALTEHPSDTATAAGTAGATWAVDQAEYIASHPFETAGALVASGGIMGGAARIGPRAGLASRGAIQPGEEILGYAGARVVPGRAGQTLFPNNEPIIFSEEAAIRGAQRAGSGLRSAGGRVRDFAGRTNVRVGNPGRIGMGLGGIEVEVEPPEVETESVSEADDDLGPDMDPFDRSDTRLYDPSREFGEQRSFRNVDQTSEGSPSQQDIGEGISGEGDPEPARESAETVSENFSQYIREQEAEHRRRQAAFRRAQTSGGGGTPGGVSIRYESSGQDRLEQAQQPQVEEESTGPPVVEEDLEFDAMEQMEGQLQSAQQPELQTEGTREIQRRYESAFDQSQQPVADQQPAFDGDMSFEQPLETDGVGELEQEQSLDLEQENAFEQEFETEPAFELETETEQEFEQEFERAFEWETETEQEFEWEWEPEQEQETEIETEFGDSDDSSDGFFPEWEEDEETFGTGFASAEELADQLEDNFGW